MDAGHVALLVLDAMLSCLAIRAMWRCREYRRRAEMAWRMRGREFEEWEWEHGPREDEE